MRITRIDIEGKDGRYARISRSRNSPWIEVEILTPDNEFAMGVAANGEDEQWTAAVNLQNELDACKGTNSMIHDYYNEIRRFAD